MKPIYFNACIFQKDGTDNTPESLAIYNAVRIAASAANIPQSIADNELSIQFCDISYSNNSSVALSAGLTSLPALLLFAEYEDGKKVRYALSNHLQDYVKPKVVKFDFVDGDLTPYLKALWNGEFGSNKESLLCKLLPPLCSISKYAWLGIAAVSTYKAVNSKTRIGQGAFGVTAAFAFSEYAKKS